MSANIAKMVNRFESIKPYKYSELSIFGSEKFVHDETLGTKIRVVFKATLTNLGKMLGNLMIGAMNLGISIANRVTTAKPAVKTTAEPAVKLEFNVAQDGTIKLDL